MENWMAVIYDARKDLDNINSFGEYRERLDYWIGMTRRWLPRVGARDSIARQRVKEHLHWLLEEKRRLRE